MKKNKGQSLIDVIFSMGIVVLVLTGVVVLIVSTAKVKRLAFERQKAVELSQLLMENKVLEIKNDPLIFWNAATNKTFPEMEGSNINSNFSGYFYVVEYDNCNSQGCDINFTVNWGDSQTLSVKRFFSRQGI